MQSFSSWSGNTDISKSTNLGHSVLVIVYTVEYPKIPNSIIKNLLCLP